ncbi:acyl-CoA thioesterase [Pedobacter sp. SYSU D00535]|uniref:acyl-CoA thioesterase n=1 Tax=Pedobacter sp. SYSU D00535 TaxID=2810308 RepID=UPI001A9771DF|nr:acyl-CoA thioesterase [Pedobacter sp. SYSU D00535]
MNIEERKALSETRIFKPVFATDTNHYSTLHGGVAMKMMDDTAFIAATRFCRLPVVTVSSDRINFSKPIPEGTIVEVVARVMDLGRTSLKIGVDIFIEQMYEERRELAIHGTLTFVALDENKKPVSIREHLRKIGVDVD